MIDAENLTKRFGNLIAVEDLTFHVDEGEVFGFLGPNGAGKTTTVRMLCCLTRLCDMCGTRIERGSFHCPECNICICFSCGIELLKKESYPANCSKCGAKLQDP